VPEFNGRWILGLIRNYMGKPGGRAGSGNNNSDYATRNRIRGLMPDGINNGVGE